MFLVDTEKVVVSILGVGVGGYTTEKKSVSEVSHILFPEIEAIRQHHAQLKVTDHPKVSSLCLRS